MCLLLCVCCYVSAVMCLLLCLSVCVLCSSYHILKNKTIFFSMHYSSSELLCYCLSVCLCVLCSSYHILKNKTFSMHDLAALLLSLCLCVLCSSYHILKNKTFFFSMYDVRLRNKLCNGDHVVVVRRAKKNSSQLEFCQHVAAAHGRAFFFISRPLTLTFTEKLSIIFTFSGAFSIYRFLTQYRICSVQFPYLLHPSSVPLPSALPVHLPS